MASLLAVGIATLLAIVLVAGYMRVLRELQRINANLEQLTKLVAGTRRNDWSLPEAQFHDPYWLGRTKPYS